MIVRTLTSLVIGITMPVCLWSTVIISTPATNDTRQTIFPGFGNIDGIKGMGFTMRALPFTLDSVTLRLCFSDQPDGCFANSDGTVGKPVVRLFSDVAGDPAGELLTFTNPIFALGTSDYTSFLTCRSRSLPGLRTGSCCTVQTGVSLRGRPTIHRPFPRACTLLIPAQSRRRCAEPAHRFRGLQQYIRGEWYTGAEAFAGASGFRGIEFSDGRCPAASCILS